MSSMLLDASVWLALSYNLHPHHQPAKIWIDRNQDRPLHFCRITQMALLRLWTTRNAVGDAVCTQRKAWRLYEALLMDPRIVFLDEPNGVETMFQRMSDRDEISPKRWTDDYLIAFATAAQLTLVTFDKALAARAPETLLLTP